MSEDADLMNHHVDAQAMITAERGYQVSKWGKDPLAVERPFVSNEVRLRVLMEEVGEIARALNDQEPLPHLLSEVIQCGAVCCAWAEGMLGEGIT